LFQALKQWRGRGLRLRKWWLGHGKNREGEAGRRPWARPGKVELLLGAMYSREREEGGHGKLGCRGLLAMERGRRGRWSQLLPGSFCALGREGRGRGEQGRGGRQGGTRACRGPTAMEVAGAPWTTARRMSPGNGSCCRCLGEGGWAAASMDRERTVLLGSHGRQH
jgi:hypothetical protein